MTSLTASRPGRLRVLAAFALLPFALALAAYLGFPLVWALGGHTGRAPEAASQFAALTGALTVLVSLVALPIVFGAIRQGRASWPRLVLVGALLGNLPFAFYVVGLILPATLIRMAQGTLSERVLPFADLMAGTANALIIGTSFGMLGAALFWAIAVRPYR